MRCLVAVLCVCAGVVVGAPAETPEKCCAPPVFEVEIKSTGHMDVGIPEYNKQIVKLVHDYKHKKWAVTQTVPRDETKNAKMIFDYKKGKQYLINDGGCREAPLEGDMVPWCIADNATFYGEYNYNRAGFHMPFTAWGWELGDTLIRLMTKATKDNCIPLQDDIFQFKESPYTYYEENPPCVPWAVPKAVIDGDCYKCYVQIPMKKKGKAAANHIAHLQYANFYHGLHREKHFKVPEDCRQGMEWGLDSFLNSVQKLLILRLQN